MVCKHAFAFSGGSVDFRESLRAGLPTNSLHPSIGRRSVNKRGRYFLGTQYSVNGVMDGLGICFTKINLGKIMKLSYR